MVRVVLLPGLDGTGDLFADLAAALGAELAPFVVSYPDDPSLGYSALTELVLAQPPKVENPPLKIFAAIVGLVAVLCLSGALRLFFGTLRFFLSGFSAPHSSVMLHYTAGELTPMARRRISVAIFRRTIFCAFPGDTGVTAGTVAILIGAGACGPSVGAALGLAAMYCFDRSNRDYATCVEE